ncbi:MAG: endonuclease/exonuclease/phosphatase family protein [Myxococcota bacterium]
MFACLGVACGASDEPADHGGAGDSGVGGSLPDDDDLSVANLNVLHGLLCPAATDSCRLGERLELFFQWIAASGCPDVVTVQEISTLMEPIFRERAATVCPFPYEVVYQRYSSIDDNLILTRYPVSEFAVLPFFGGFRQAIRARIQHPRGPVEVISAHLSSGSDMGGAPCGDDCPPECVAAAASTRRQCQAVQLADLVLASRAGAIASVVAGDMNATPDSPEMLRLSQLGWIDTYLAAGHPECDPATGLGCTVGRRSDELSELEDVALAQSARVDYIFLAPTEPDDGTPRCSELDAPAVGDASHDSVGDGDGDGDGIVTGGFAHRPNPFAEDCGAAPAITPL